MTAHVLPPAPAVQRPRVLVVGTAFAAAASFMVFVGLIGILLTLPMLQQPFTMALERMLAYF